MKNILRSLSEKKINLLFVVLFTAVSSATTVNGRFVEVNEPGTDSVYTLKIQINTDTGLDDLGGATFVVSFDTTQLEFSSSPAAGRDYFFSGLLNENYSHRIVTRVLGNQVWLNLVLNSSDNGSVVKGPGSWSELITLRFRINSSGPENHLKWEIESPFWAVYDGNNENLWETGEFNNTPAVEEKDHSPDSYQLCQNFPNPFNPETTINFYLKAAGSVKLTILNILGEEVKVLLNETLEEGFHSCSFEGSDLASGIYIYKLNVDNIFSDVRKMILLK